MATPIPVVLVGKTAQMGDLVTANLQPEIEVIHFISTPETAQLDLPRLLSNLPPTKPSDEGIGSQNYSRPPEAILLGLAYHNELVDELREACKGTVRSVPWLQGGLSKSELDDLMANSPLAPTPQQGPITADKVKRTFLQVFDDGQGGRDGVFEWYDKSAP